jgi:hypothetical protein
MHKETKEYSERCNSNKGSLKEIYFNVGMDRIITPKVLGVFFIKTASK